MVLVILRRSLEAAVPGTPPEHRFTSSLCSFRLFGYNNSERNPVKGSDVRRPFDFLVSRVLWWKAQPGHGKDQPRDLLAAESMPRAGRHKIAARWTDGRPGRRLKTYGFACSEHLGNIFRSALDRQQHYTPGPGETIEELAIYFATSPENATASCNDCGDWKRTYRS